MKKKQICNFSTGGMLESPIFLGERVHAIIEVLVPCNVTQFKSFLRMLNYCCNFNLVNLSTLLVSLYKYLAVESMYSDGDFGE